MNLLERAEQASADPILGLTEDFQRDERPSKVNLGVGVYLDEQGQLPLLAAVKEAQERIVAQGKAHAYLPIDGLPSYRSAVRELLFDQAIAERVASVQTLAGTGALKVGADLLRSLSGDAKVLISNPSWENHRALFRQAGFQVETYRYYDAQAKGIDFEGMLEDLVQAPAGTIVVLHACCHNPTGYDLTPEQWDRVIETLRSAQLFPFLDMAYQGFAEGVVADARVVDQCAAAGLTFLLATSHSKTFGLYGQRAGSLHAVTAGPDEAARVLSQLKVLIRTNYSNPPTFGGAIVATILEDAQLRAQWEQELGVMRERITGLRSKLVAGLEAHGVFDMGFIGQQRGMFSYSGLTKEQMQRLRHEFGIYGTDSGRMCVAALNDRNLSQVAEAIATVRR